MCAADRPCAVGGWFAGCCAATAVIYAFFMILSWILSGGGSVWAMAANAFMSLFAAAIILLCTIVLSGIPAALTIWLGRRFRIHSLAFFGCSGALTGALGQFVLFRSFELFGCLFAVAGLAAGVTYWFVSGRHAGREPG